MAARRPQDEAALLQASGVREKKLVLYGREFLELLTGRPPVTDARERPA